MNEGPRVMDPDGTLLRLLVETSVAAVVGIDRAGLVTSWNAGAERMVGYTAAEMIGRSVSMLVAPQRLDDQPATHALFLRGERLDNFETVRRCKDGTLIHVALTVVPVRDASGQVVGATTVARDISERKRADEERDKLVQLIDHSGDVIAMADLQGQLTFMNAAGRRVLGVADDQDLRSLHLGDYVSAGWQAFVASVLTPGARASGLWEGEMQLRNRQTGRDIDVAQATFLLRDEGAMPTAFATVMRDITAAKRAEAVVRQGKKMESIGTLAGGIAHDFNNITAAVMGFAELATLQLEPAHPARDSLREILVAAGRARELVRQIMSFARQTPHVQDVTSLQTTVERSVRLLRATLPANVELLSTFAPGAVPVLVDTNQLEQVILNLGTNGWHALDGKPGRLTIALDSTDIDAAVAAQVPGLFPGPYAVLAVTDTGVGMDVATRERMFDPFFTTKPHGVGTGLGLAMVHGIIGAHGGAIDVASEPGQGTTVRVYLPQAAAPKAVDASPPDPLPERQPPKKPATGDRILYLDDEAALVKMSVRLLDRLGYRTTGFTSATEALQAIGQRPGEFDLVVSDLNMPDMSGLDVGRAVHALGRRLPVMLYSGDISETLRERALHAGISRVLAKPSTIESMSQAIQEVLAAHRS